MTDQPWPRRAAAAAGFVWFLQVGGWQTLDPTNVNWVMAGDWLQHWLGWLFFRRDPWTFPLGRILSLPYPAGTTIGFTDSNPLVSLLLKPFSPFLPTTFQFLGPWFAVCFVLQGYMGALLSSVVTKRPWEQFLGGVLFAMSPVLVARLGHDTLCAHWLLLGLLYLGLREYEGAAAATRAVRWATAGAVVSAAIHPYLAAMCWVLAHAFFVRLWVARTLTFARTTLAAGSATAGMIGVFWAIGYFGGEQLGTGGYGQFSSDLLTLVSPMGFSRLLPMLDRLDVFQWEGLGYLGLGGILLAVTGVVGLVRSGRAFAPHTWPVVTACVLMALYAVSTIVTFNGRVVLRLDWLTPTSIPFRASGRFIWSFHYLLLLLGVWGATRAFPMRRGWASTAVLAAGVLVQVADVRCDAFWFTGKEFRQARVFNYRLAIGHYRHLELYPAQILGIGSRPYEEDHTYRYMLLAYKLNMTFNSGIFARMSRRDILAAAAWNGSALDSGMLDRQTVYLVSPDYVEKFKAVDAACAQLDGDWACVSRKGHEAFRAYLESNAEALASGR
jgi:hypothetical protein